MKRINHSTPDYTVQISAEARHCLANEMTLAEAKQWHSAATGDDLYFATGAVLRAQAIEQRKPA